MVHPWGTNRLFIAFGEQPLLRSLKQSSTPCWPPPLDLVKHGAPPARDGRRAHPWATVSAIMHFAIGVRTNIGNENTCRRPSNEGAFSRGQDIGLRLRAGAAGILRRVAGRHAVSAARNLTAATDQLACRRRLVEPNDTAASEGATDLDHAPEPDRRLRWCLPDSLMDAVHQHSGQIL